MKEEEWTYEWKDGKRVKVKKTKGTWQDAPYEQTEYEDGSSETDFGGPCGPIYTDRNGEQ